MRLAAKIRAYRQGLGSVEYWLCGVVRVQHSSLNSDSGHLEIMVVVVDLMTSLRKGRRVSKGC
jgi:hypothetical protein